MRVVVAPDKFTGSLTAVEAAEAIGEGLRRGRPGVAPPCACCTRSTWPASTRGFPLPSTHVSGLETDGLRWARSEGLSPVVRLNATPTQ